MTTTATPIELIKRLRGESGAGISSCRLALEQAGSDYAAALDLLREQAAAEAAKRASRQASQGRMEIYSHGDGRIGVMVEVNCETDFAARSDVFRSLAHEIALHIAASAPRWVRDEDIPAEVLAEEAKKVAARSQSEGKPEVIIPRIVEGYLNKFKDRTVLLRQPFIRDDSQTVAQLIAQATGSVGENIIIRRFERWELIQGEY
jgi:elongation factor Ts